MIRPATEGGGKRTRRSARRLASGVLSNLARAIREVRANDDLVQGDEKSAQRVHALRVSARRAGVVLRALAPHDEPRAWRRARRMARRLRRAAGAVRECDVHRALFDELLERERGAASPETTRGAREHLCSEWDAAAKGLREAVAACGGGAFARAARRVVKSLDAPVERSGAAQRAWARTRALAERCVAASRADLSGPEAVHELRLAVKRVRYALELLGPAMPGAAGTGALLEQLEAAQRVFGEANDVSTLVDRLDRDMAGGAEAEGTSHLRALRDRFARVRDRRFERALAWWRSSGVERALGSLAPEPPVVETPGPLVLAAGAPREVGPRGATVVSGSTAMATKEGPLNGRGSHSRAGRAVRAGSVPGGTPEESTAGAPRPGGGGESQRSLFLSGRRLGVIDIGSNSIRLLCVELSDERTWKVLGEERAMTRLAQGLARGGGLSPDAMARSVEAIGRFKGLAEGLGCAVVRAFATAAVREADNRDDFVSLVRDRTGLALEMVSALDEGKLTFRSVARVLDLSRGTSAVVDIGGGSLEVVLARDEVITANQSMPLGAVRLTEAFGGADACAGREYKDMRRFIARQIARRVPEPATPPSVLVGCGGTFTTLLTLGAASRGVMLDRASPALASLGPVSLVQLRGMIESLREVNLEERLRVPGLPSDRADIVIAGFTVIERLMTHLGVSQVHVHPGGFREGLMLRMIDDDLVEFERAALNASDDDHMAWVRAFAQRCGYERAHSEQVARLALRLYDQFREESDLIRGLGGERHERLLLEAAAVLHDVGIMVEYPRHHKHSRTIIRHADLRGFTPREIELIALVARYHRRATPQPKHDGFKGLSEPDRALVRRLAGILRVADGLDRAHAQQAADVRVRFGKGEVTLEVESQGDARTDIEAADAKADLLRDVLGVGLSIVAVGNAPATPE
ncbi:MAG: CHAD domain-containing protein [Planctomycetota bacterium]|nr:CHAD domain-containing protein [Planctomycetota bacterium]